MEEIQISDHAYARYLERTGANHKYRAKILKAIEQGNEVRPVNGFMKLLRNNCRDAKYYHFNQLVVVVSEDGEAVITVMDYIKSKWINT